MMAAVAAGVSASALASALQVECALAASEIFEDAFSFLAYRAQVPPMQHLLHSSASGVWKQPLHCAHGLHPPEQARNCAAH